MQPTNVGTGRAIPIVFAASEIPLAARIVAVCDAYDAIITDRCYSPARTPHAAREELAREAGHQFDPEVVAAFLEELDRTDPTRQTPTRPTGTRGPRTTTQSSPRRSSVTYESYSSSEAEPRGPGTGPRRPQPSTAFAGPSGTTSRRARRGTGARRLDRAQSLSPTAASGFHQLTAAELADAFGAIASVVLPPRVRLSQRRPTARGGWSGVSTVVDGPEDDC